MAISNALDGLNRQPTWAPHLRIVIGAALILFGLYRWFTRNRSAHTPGWLTSMTSIGPGAPSSPPWCWPWSTQGVVHVRRSGSGNRLGGLGATGAWTADVVFTAVAASSVALPVLAYLIAGEKLDAR